MRPPAPNILKHLQILNSEPLELEYLHTVARRRGWDDMIYDGFNTKKSARDVMKSFQPDVVAVTGYITQENLMKKYVKTAKEVNPSVVTVVGGVHVQLNFERMYTADVDYVFRSENVNAFGDLLAYFMGSALDLSTVSGLCYRENGEWRANKLLPFNINDLPIPDRSFFYQNKSWFRYLDLTEVATLKTAISCPYNCNFCYCTCLGGGRYSVRDLDKVMDELEGLDCETVLIADDVFLFDEGRVWGFINEVRRRNIKKQYLCYGRADYIAAHPEQIKALAEIGFVYFFVGLEAITDRELESYNKQITADVNVRCTEAVHAAGARCFALMIAPADATKQYFTDLYQWVLAHEVKYVTVSIFTPIPGTPLYEEYKDKLITDDIEEWDFLHLVAPPTRLTKRAFYLEYYKLTNRLYRLAKKTGAYDFMDLEYYKNVVMEYFRQKAREK
jgi:radical SAM superfamily enzyme YgiQ (UPF0313 family)